MDKVYFKSKDGLKITADYYKVENHKGLMLLCHRSHSNRGEYKETAPKFNKLGYSCLAIDQRSGMKVFGNVNETKNRAKEQGLTTGYLDAKQDIESAVDYAYELNNKTRISLISIPVFVTSSKKEINQVSILIKEVDPVFIDHFKPGVEGFHGSKSLWKSVKGFETYWNALEQFLDKTD